ncbi:TetR/AcrR family transcriptional regulator [Nonomuraea phyllanthi]|uniref:TetR/AcrR family transcriptional regulator n=1 Tax=Nonomuraea phyllanthi TaxID=2219224 RepID=UPI001D007203|nr:TetR/AcrR family transcriptional regulator [Nonomuraea phyllanthi]
MAREPDRRGHARRTGGKRIGEGRRSRAAILQAAVDLGAERGYNAVTMEAIASRAHVGKPTLYRWWSSKGTLFLDALTERFGEPYFQVGDTGDLIADLRNWLYGITELFLDPVLSDLVAGVAGAAQHDPELAAILHQQLHLALSGRNQERIRAGQRDGQLIGFDPLLLEDLLVAPLWYRLLITARPISRAYADTILNTVLSAAAPSSGQQHPCWRS